ncbi:MAG: hypothetical protein K2Y51_15350 [Gammaproteobacteria bacterium]|nr:hypothetical protein [Gammaproteobacteria bacterium]
MIRRLERPWVWLAMCATGAALAQDAPPPDVELLEFLGEWTDASGRFVDPTLEGATPSASDEMTGDGVTAGEVQDDAP